MNRFQPFALSIEERRTARAYLQRTWTEEYRRGQKRLRTLMFLAAAIVGTIVILMIHLGGN